MRRKWTSRADPRPDAGHAHIEIEPQTPLGDRSTLLHAGSTITSHLGTGVVCCTGDLTEIGRIAEEEAQVPPWWCACGALPA